ncbi:tetratricopeptide repeat protein [Flavobacterium granuli]|uniref:Tetratricopeptide repeat protein n=1 Tax=Flavobacterium granuli TaxID=280093 RepID=A0A1M5T1F2_9FLAO|nr:tetratricopeptide repeat protein [Flavobacterium granuli]PRZ20650.1 tetratricopeptide repeat protein [Flavobacterium granuli]SHH44173.1 Tetratricopeptide repeat-containing protein [Flavobacterium granuli]
MKPYKLIPVLVFTILFIFACDTKNTQITKVADYNNYLKVKENKALDFAHAEIDFWQKKFDKAPNQSSYLGIIASKYATLFEYTGDVSHLYKAEELLTKVNESYKYSKVAAIRSLARNYISQHRFKEALVLANKAFAIGEGRKETQKLLFDVQMELGNYTEAEKNLNAVKDMNDFDYLIRLAKWNDHKGDLETAITFMEKARDIAEKEDNKTLKIWSYSNLGDFYGHAGRIQESYDCYLKTLAIDPNYSYALKGIAWIVFSHERNTKEANRIVEAIELTHNTPDFYLLKSQIAQFEGNKEEALHERNAYFCMQENNDYGAMYNKYNTLIYADVKETASKALAIAKIEVNHRPTPDSYDLLAWSYLKMGQNKKALEIAEKHVQGKTFEPKVQYHLAMIYKSNNKMNKVAPIKQELLSSIYELGPNMEEKVKQL